MTRISRPAGACLHLPADLPAVAARHHDIEQDDRRLDGGEQRHRFVAVVCDGDRIPTSFEVIPDDVGIVLVIIDHED